MEIHWYSVEAHIRNSSVSFEWLMTKLSIAKLQTSSAVTGWVRECHLTVSPVQSLFHQHCLKFLSPLIMLYKYHYPEKFLSNLTTAKKKRRSWSLVQSHFHLETLSHSSCTLHCYYTVVIHAFHHIHTVPQLLSWHPVISILQVYKQSAISFYFLSTSQPKFSS